MAQQMQQPAPGQQFGGQEEQYGIGSQGYGVQGGYGEQMGYGGQGAGLRLQDVESPQQRAAIDGITRAVQTAEWCADQCAQLGDPNVGECIRLCEDVSELGEAVLTLVPRQSRFAGQAAQTLLQAVQACGQECSRHGHAHCQETAQVLSATEGMLQQFLGGGQGEWQGGQQSTGQSLTGQQPNRQPVGQSPQQPIGQSTQQVGGQPMQQPIGQQSAGQQSAGQQPIGQQSAGQQSAGQQSAGQQSAGQQPIGQPMEQL